MVNACSGKLNSREMDSLIILAQNSIAVVFKCLLGKWSVHTLSVPGPF